MPFGTLKLGVALSRTHWHDALLPVYGLHLGVSGVGVMANDLQLLGHPDQASRCADELAEVIRADTHPLASIGALWGTACFYQLRGDAARALEPAEALMRQCTAHGPADWVHFGEALHGWALVVQGQAALGVARVHSGAEGLRSTGAGSLEPYVLGLAADAHRRLGEAAEARAVLLRAFAAAKRNGPGLYDAELHRLDGELRLDSAEAEACFRQALEVARSQHAKSWELRAAMSLGDLWRGQGKEDEARAIVSETYGWFTEGFDTPDLKRARAFLHAPSERDEALMGGRE